MSVNCVVPNRPSSPCNLRPVKVCAIVQNLNEENNLSFRLVDQDPTVEPLHGFNAIKEMIKRMKYFFLFFGGSIFSVD